MKKWMALCLVLAMTLCLLACSGSGKAKEDPNALQVGYGRVDITPDYPMAIAGSAATRISEGCLDPLYFTTIAIKQAEELFLIVTMDLVGAYSEYTEALQMALSNAAEIPKNHVILNATHTHASVSIRNIESENCPKYREELAVWAVESATAAVADLSPAEVWYGSTQAEGMAWVRHYKMADGTYAGANFGSFSSGIVGHAAEADTEMQLVRFVRPADDKKDIVLMNFPAHATMCDDPMLSADFPGPARQYVAEQTDTLVAYFIAGAGNQVPSSRIPEENFSTNYQVYGEELGRIAVACLGNMTKLEDTQLRFQQKTYIGKSNKEDLDRLGDALKVDAIWSQVGGRGTDAGKKAAKEAGFSSVYEVTAILNRSHFQEKRTMELVALSVGDVGFIFAPYEMFGPNAMTIKQESPYAMTFIVTCSQNHDGYLPSTYGCEIRCYEAQITKFTPGTAEILASEYVTLLTEMKNK